MSNLPLPPSEHPGLRHARLFARDLAIGITIAALVCAAFLLFQLAKVAAEPWPGCIARLGGDTFNPEFGDTIEGGKPRCTREIIL